MVKMYDDIGKCFTDNGFPIDLRLSRVYQMFWGGDAVASTDFRQRLVDVKDLLKSKVLLKDRMGYDGHVFVYSSYVALRFLLDGPESETAARILLIANSDNAHLFLPERPEEVAYTIHLAHLYHLRHKLQQHANEQTNCRIIDEQMSQQVLHSLNQTKNGCLEALSGHAGEAAQNLLRIESMLQQLCVSQDQLSAKQDQLCAKQERAPVATVAAEEAGPESANAPEVSPVVEPESANAPEEPPRWFLPHRRSASAGIRDDRGAVRRRVTSEGYWVRGTVYVRENAVPSRRVCTTRRQ